MSSYSARKMRERVSSRGDSSGTNNTSALQLLQGLGKRRSTRRATRGRLLRRAYERAERDGDESDHMSDGDQPHVETMEKFSPQPRKSRSRRFVLSSEEEEEPAGLFREEIG